MRRRIAVVERSCPQLPIQDVHSVVHVGVAGVRGNSGCRGRTRMRALSTSKSYRPGPDGQYLAAFDGSSGGTRRPRGLRHLDDQDGGALAWKPVGVLTEMGTDGAATLLTRGNLGHELAEPVETELLGRTGIGDSVGADDEAGQHSFRLAAANPSTKPARSGSPGGLRITARLRRSASRYRANSYAWRSPTRRCRNGWGAVHPMAPRRQPVRHSWSVPLAACHTSRS